MSIGISADVITAALARLGTVDSVKLAPTADAKTSELANAVDLYSRVRPRARTFEFAGDNLKRRFVLRTDVAGWRNGSSKLAPPLQTVENAGTNSETITDMEDLGWSLSVNPSGDDVLMLASVIPTGQTFRLHWQDLHTVHASDAALTTVPDSDKEPFVSLVAHFLAAWIARTSADLTAASIGIDQVDLESVSERFAKRARELRKDAMDRLAPEEGSEISGSGGASITWDPSRSALSGGRRIAH